MAIAERDQRVLDSLAAARGRHKELAELLDFYFDLYQLQFRAKGEVPEPEIRDELAMRWRLQGGIPQLTFDQLRLDPEPFVRLAARVAEVVLRHNPGWQLEPKDWRADDVAVCAQEVFETWDTLTAPRPGSSRAESEYTPSGHQTMLAISLALAPYLQKGADVILPRLDLTGWVRGHCPICGGRPNFALLDAESGARSLICSRCAAIWSYRRIGCPFCATEERPVFYSRDDGLYRLYVCQACRGYLKAADLRKARRNVHPMVERLLTVGMDLAAQQEGYGA